MIETIEDKFNKFPKRVRLTIDTMFDEREYRIQFTYKGRTFLPGSGKWFGLAESLNYAYSAFCTMFPDEAIGDGNEETQNAGVTEHLNPI